ncbi:protein-arginine deiminase (PAD) domain-containing protein [Hirsutella rhossiliensis]
MPLVNGLSTSTSARPQRSFEQMPAVTVGLIEVLTHIAGRDSWLEPAGPLFLYNIEDPDGPHHLQMVDQGLASSIELFGDDVGKSKLIVERLRMLSDIEQSMKMAGRIIIGGNGYFRDRRYIDEYPQLLPANTSRRWCLMVNDPLAAVRVLEEAHPKSFADAKLQCCQKRTDHPHPFLMIDEANNGREQHVQESVEILKQETGRTDDEIFGIPVLYRTRISKMAAAGPEIQRHSGNPRRNLIRRLTNMNDVLEYICPSVINGLPAHHKQQTDMLEEAVVRGYSKRGFKVDFAEDFFFVARPGDLRRSTNAFLQVARLDGLVSDDCIRPRAKSQNDMAYFHGSSPKPLCRFGHRIAFVDSGGPGGLEPSERPCTNASPRPIDPAARNGAKAEMRRQEKETSSPSWITRGIQVARTSHWNSGPWLLLANMTTPSHVPRRSVVDVRHDLRGSRHVGAFETHSLETGPLSQGPKTFGKETKHARGLIAEIRRARREPLEHLRPFGPDSQVSARATRRRLPPMRDTSEVEIQCSRDKRRPPAFQPTACHIPFPMSNLAGPPPGKPYPSTWPASWQDRAGFRRHTVPVLSHRLPFDYCYSSRPNQIAKMKSSPKHRPRILTFHSTGIPLLLRRALRSRHSGDDDFSSSSQCDAPPKSPEPTSNSKRDAIEDLTEKCPDVEEPCARAFNAIRIFQDTDETEDDIGTLKDDLKARHRTRMNVGTPLRGAEVSTSLAFS